MNDDAALQLYYTSCRRGLSGYAGFQTRAESKGLQLDERRELEGKALYQPPRDLPREPDADSIADQFPKSFKVFSLSSGRMALVRAVYTGKDYSERWGNYFAHCLILDKMLDAQWPIDAYTWPGWVGGFVYGEDEAEPEPLPTVPLSDLATGTDFAFDELKTFLCEAKGRPEVLAMMLCAVFRRASDSRSVLIRERLELDAVYWVACIQKAFPPACQRELTCSTFQFDPRSSLAVNATIGDTDFLFDEGERRYQFYVFDFVNGEHSDVPAEYAEYARAISAWMASDPQRLRGFHEFSSLFDYPDIGPELLHILRLYQLEGGEQAALTKPELHAVLEFVSARARPAAYGRVLACVGDVTRGLAPTAPPEDWALIIRFVTECAVSTGEAEYRRHACRTWIDAFDHFVIRAQGGEEVVLPLRGEIEERFGHDGNDMAREFLSDVHLDWLWENAACLPEKSLSIVLPEIEKSCRQLGNEPTYQALEVLNLIESVLYCNPGQPRDLQWALAPFQSQVEGLSSVVGHIVTILEDQVRDGAAPRKTWETACRAVGRSLSAVFSPGSDELRFRLLNRLKVDGRFSAVLVGEWDASIDQAPDKVKAHARYHHNILSDNSKFAVEMQDEMAAALLKKLPREHQQRQARHWVESGRCRQLSDGVASVVLALASRDVKLSPADQVSSRLANQISQELGVRRLTLDTDRLELRAAACRALYEPDGTDDLRDVIMRADAETYREFVGIVLPQLLTRATTAGSHRKVILAMAIDTHIQAFAEIYAAFLTQRPIDRFDEVDDAVALFWLQLGKSDPSWPVLGHLKKHAINSMAIRLGSMRRKARATAEARLKEIKQMAAVTEPQLAKALDSFSADALRPSWLNRILHRSKR